MPPPPRLNAAAQARGADSSPRRRPCGQGKISFESEGPREPPGYLEETCGGLCGGAASRGQSLHGRPLLRALCVRRACAEDTTSMPCACAVAVRTCSAHAPCVQYACTARALCTVNGLPLYLPARPDFFSNSPAPTNATTRHQRHKPNRSVHVTHSMHPPRSAARCHQEPFGSRCRLSYDLILTESRPKRRARSSGRHSRRVPTGVSKKRVQVSVCCGMVTAPSLPRQRDAVPGNGATATLGGTNEAWP
eukprot:gene8-biopygen16540